MEDFGSIMPLRRLHPIASAVFSAPALLNLVNEIETYISPRNGHLPDNAALVYLVLALAYEQAGIASIASFPRLRLHFGSEQIEVSWWSHLCLS